MALRHVAWLRFKDGVSPSESRITWLRAACSSVASR